MSTKTRIELVNRVGALLMVVSSGNALESDDQQSIDAVVDTVVSDLATRGVVSVMNIEEIELAVFEYVAQIIADFCAPDFGQERNPQKIEYCEGKLYALGMSSPTYETAKGEYF